MNRPFRYQHETLSADAVALTEVAAQFGTPCYVYSASGVVNAFNELTRALSVQRIRHRICYAVKANSNLALLQLLARQGAHFDVVSIGELRRVLRAGGAAENMIFSGVGKRADEVQTALAAGIGCLNVESASELELIARIAAELKLVANIGLRVNPNVDAKTHPYIATGLKENKFGIAMGAAYDLGERLVGDPWLRLNGIGCHIGSQILDVTPLRAAFSEVASLSDALEQRGHRFSHMDLGGGLGIAYRDEKPIEFDDYATLVGKVLAPRPHLTLLIEPGRRIVGPSGVLLTQVLHLKQQSGRDFAVVDAAMNDLIRPALYGAWQDVLPVVRAQKGQASTWQIVGPICESGDFLAKDRELSLAPGQLLAIMDAGAYGFVMSSNYNTRPRAAEVLLWDGKAHLVRQRETLEAMLEGERLLPEARFKGNDE